MWQPIIKHTINVTAEVLISVGHGCRQNKTSEAQYMTSLIVDENHKISLKRLLH